VSNEPSDRLLTIPNLLSLLRALGIPIFLYLYLNHYNAYLIFGILAVASATDYLDGKIARAFNQSSKLGALLDPTVDRLYILAILIAFALEKTLPLWIILILLFRDLLLALITLAMKLKGKAFFEVSFLGKAATFNLLYAFPLLILASQHGPGKLAYLWAMAFVGWGVPLYLWTGFIYAKAGISAIWSKSK
jgi:cardiolipin synthase